MAKMKLKIVQHSFFQREAKSREKSGIASFLSQDLGGFRKKIGHGCQVWWPKVAAFSPEEILQGRSPKQSLRSQSLRSQSLRSQSLRSLLPRGLLAHLPSLEDGEGVKVSLDSGRLKRMWSRACVQQAFCIVWLAKKTPGGGGVIGVGAGVVVVVEGADDGAEEASYLNRNNSPRVSTPGESIRAAFIDSSSREYTSLADKLRHLNKPRREWIIEGSDSIVHHPKDMFYVMLYRIFIIKI